MLRIDDTAARSVALNIKPKTEMDPNDVGAKAMRLKKIWIFFMQKVFEYPLLHGYNGDIIFLEDDLIVSKDALTVLDFLSGCKNGHVTHIKNTKQDRLIDLLCQTLKKMALLEKRIEKINKKLKIKKRS